MKQPLVSIVLPTFNRANFILKTIRSILSQDYPNIKLIIINDGSKDNTKKIIKTIKDTRIVYLEKKNEGPASARNLGIQKSTGKYIAFCDDDDLFLPGKLQEQITFLEKNMHLAFCYTNGFILENSKRKKFLQKLTQNNLSQLLFDNSQILTPTVTVRTKIIKELGGFDKKIPLCEDYDLWLRIAQKYKFDFIDKPYVEIHKHKNNISNDGKKLFEYGVFVKIKNLKQCQYKFPLSLERKLKWSLMYQQGKYYFFENNIKKSRNFLLKALIFYPFSIKPLLFLIFTYLGEKKFDNYFIPIYQKMKKRQYIKNWDVDSN